MKCRTKTMHKNENAFMNVYQMVWALQVFKKII